MTPQEHFYNEFAAKYSYDYQANEDGAKSTVIFSFWQKSNPIDTFVKYEAKTLEKAFNHALVSTGIVRRIGCYILNSGDITRFNHEKWNEQTEKDMFFSIQDQCMKSKKEMIAIENGTNNLKKFYLSHL